MSLPFLPVVSKKHREPSARFCLLEIFSFFANEVFLSGRLKRFRLPPMPRRAGVDGQARGRKAHHAERKRPSVGTRQVEDRPARPRAERHADTESDFQKSENRADIFAGKYIADDRAVGRIARAVAESIQYGRRVDEPRRRAGVDRDKT